MAEVDHVLDHRAKYHRLADVEAVVSHGANGTKTRVVTKRCAVEEKLWGGMTDVQQAAAEHVYRGFLAMHGSPLQAFDIAKALEPKGTSAGLDARTQLRRDYTGWQEECQDRNIDFRPAVDQCGLGLSFRGQSPKTAYRRRASEHFHLSLDVMAELKGWK